MNKLFRWKVKSYTAFCLKECLYYPNCEEYEKKWGPCTVKDIMPPNIREEFDRKRIEVMHAQRNTESTGAR